MSFINVSAVQYITQVVTSTFITNNVPQMGPPIYHYIYNTIIADTKKDKHTLFQQFSVLEIYGRGA